MRSCHLWLEAARDCWLIAAEACVVVPLRLARLAGGGEQASAEVQLMIGEKLEANGALLADLAGGRLGANPSEIASGIAGRYLGLVRQNRRRLMDRKGK
jgi:hypothetical protein